MAKLGSLNTPAGPYVMTASMFADLTFTNGLANQLVVPLKDGEPFVPTVDDVILDIHVFVPIRFENDPSILIYAGASVGVPPGRGGPMNYELMDMGVQDADDGFLLYGQNDRYVSVRDNDLGKGSVPTLPARVTVAHACGVAIDKGNQSTPTSTTGEAQFYFYTSHP